MHAKMKDPRFLWFMPKAKDHSFGSLCLFPKRKCWTIKEDGRWELIGGWDAIKWRPLVSYHRHHSRKVLGTAGQGLVGLVRDMPGAYHVDKPQQVVQGLGHFADRAVGWQGPTGIYMLDIKNFFNKIPRQDMLGRLQSYVESVRASNRHAEYL